jgi:hypothetical protein
MKGRLGASASSASVVGPVWKPSSSATSLDESPSRSSSPVAELGRLGYPSDVTASDPGERPASAERPPTEPEPEVTPREVRRREREGRRGERPEGMVPGRERRRTKLERGTMRLVATGGIIGIAVLLGAVLVGQDVAGWIVGLVVGLTSVILAALLWSSRQL